MPDWTAGMKQTFEYYEVDPFSWKKKRLLDNLKNATINRDNTAETLGSATIDSSNEYGEMYVRVYLITIQNGIKEDHSLGTFLIQTPHDKYDGKVHSFSYDAYTPLLELKDDSPPIGYFLPKESNIMSMAGSLCFDNTRVPVIFGSAEDELIDDFVAEPDDTWLTFITDLVANAKFRLGLDELSRIIFIPDTDTASLQPVWEYNDNNSSILYPDIDMERDLYGIPNVVEVVYTNALDATVSVEIVNDDPDSPTSTVTRGRRVLHRETSPSFNGTPSESEIHEYAVGLLRELSTLEYSITYTHGYCPVRPGDGVLLNYNRAGLRNRKAKVVSQTIKCEPGCPVEETAVFTVKMWEG